MNDIIIATPKYTSGNGFFKGTHYTFKKSDNGLTYMAINSNGHERVESTDTLLNNKPSAHLCMVTAGFGDGIWDIISM